MVFYLFSLSMVYSFFLVFMFFFFKQKTAYEMRISDWSSDVCSSDLRKASRARSGHAAKANSGAGRQRIQHLSDRRTQADRARLKVVARAAQQIGRASCRERVCQSV